MNKSKVLSNWDFKFMAFFFKIRDFFKSPMNKIEKIGLKKGDRVLDYGCGIGSYTIEAAKVIGEKGKIYAADIHPSAVKKVKKKAKKEELANIKTIQTDLKTGLENNSIDVVICFDVLHNIQHQKELLKEFHRVLKDDGLLAFDDHHWEETEILDIFSSQNLYDLKQKKSKQYIFSPKKNKNHKGGK